MTYPTYRYQKKRYKIKNGNNNNKIKETQEL